MRASSGYEISYALLIGYLVLPLYACLAAFLDKITPRKNGIPEHPLFFLQSLYERALYRKGYKFREITWG